MTVFPLDRGHNGREAFRNASHGTDSVTCLRFGSRWMAPGLKTATALLRRGFGKRSRCKHRIRHLRAFFLPTAGNDTLTALFGTVACAVAQIKLRQRTNELSSPCDLIGALPLYARQRAGQNCMIRSGRGAGPTRSGVWRGDNLSRRWAKMPQQIASTLNKDRSIHS
jgi:hypothetical protein